MVACRDARASCSSSSSLTLSRSGWLGLGVGGLILLIPYRRFVFTKAARSYPVGARSSCSAASSCCTSISSRRCFGQRFSTSGSSTQAHFAIYSYIGPMLHTYPLLGLGENNFVGPLPVPHRQGELRRRTRTGSRSIVESGLIGLLLWIVFLRYVFVRLIAARRLGRLLDRSGDEEGSRVRPLAWGYHGGARRDDGRELLLPDDAVLLLLRVPGARARAAARLRRTGAAGAAAEPLSMDRPNILFLLTDQQRADALGMHRRLGEDAAHRCVGGGGNRVRPRLRELVRVRSRALQPRHRPRRAPDGSRPQPRRDARPADADMELDRGRGGLPHEPLREDASSPTLRGR